MKTKLLATTRPKRRSWTRAGLLLLLLLAGAGAAGWWAWQNGGLAPKARSLKGGFVATTNSIASNFMTRAPHTPGTILRTQELAASAASPSNDWSVLEAQVALDRLALSPGSIDGVAGSQTRAALRAFQMREGLPQTGELD